MSLNLDAPLLWLVYTCKEPRISGILCYTFWTSQVALVVKIPPVNAGETRATGSIPGLGWPPREGSVNPLQYSWLKNYMDRGTWQAAVHGVTKSRTWLSNCPHIHLSIYLFIFHLPSLLLLNFHCIKLYNLYFHEQMFSFSIVCLRYNHTFTCESIFSFPSYVRIHCMNMSQLYAQSWWVSQTLMS